VTKTAAERQKAYRARRAQDHRLNLYVSPEAGTALARLCKLYRLTQRQMLERLTLTAEADYLQTLKPDSPEWLEYHGHLDPWEPEP
jgi:hypothetical protein